MNKKIYKQFIVVLFKNYIFGSFMAVFGIGALFMFTTLDISVQETITLLTILIVSLVIMITVEISVFLKHIRPIKTAFYKENLTIDDLREAYKQTHRFPLLTVYRIFGPHLFGLALPAMLISYISIHNGFLDLPFYYIGIAFGASVLVAGMHSVIEFFLSTNAIKPILMTLQNESLANHDVDFAHQSHLYLSIQRKILLSAIFISVFPLLLFSLATHFRFTEASIPLLAEYWSWAVFVLIVSIIFAIYGAYLLYNNISEPIQKLEDGMQKIQIGQLTYQNDVYSDEFSRLISGYNQMVSGLKRKDQINTQLLDSLFTTLALALDARDTYTAGHSVRVANYSIIIGKEAKLDKETLDLLRKSALLHDIGKIGIKDSILLKDGRLTDEEYNEIKNHPVIGANILSQVQPKEEMDPLIPGVKYHHERYDGLGYPEGLKGEDIPLFGRIMAVADAYDAMTSDRPYRNGMPINKALSIIEEGKGTQWDPYFAELFLLYMKNNTIDSKNYKQPV
ncbi:HD domain-containing phosphohydrolase [Bacillus weihaiensis]|uniref:HD domain-containing phosphohydrolase n=1 Tax=Bacillus weihaiensis TaxID=1547283 RepID=UPI0023578386|nr:HD domain-containing phosphohydrolase [Bacillus weihaiensis]